MKTLILSLVMLAASTASADRLWKDSYRFRKVSQAEIQASLAKEEQRLKEMEAFAKKQQPLTAAEVLV
ncbi:MAG: hypothetical protein AAF202_11360, partial [Pseudomonadota bacterium]